MANFISIVLTLLFGLLPYITWGVVLYLALEAFWALAQWVYGLNLIMGLHRSDLYRALVIERDATGNPVPR